MYVLQVPCIAKATKEDKLNWVTGPIQLVLFSLKDL